MKKTKEEKLLQFITQLKRLYSMGNYFDINGTIGGRPAEFKVIIEDYADFGECYQVYHDDCELGYFCRLPNGEYKVIDHSELTIDEMVEIGEQVNTIRTFRVAS